jgi:hypothetical protein
VEKGELEISMMLLTAFWHQKISREFLFEAARLFFLSFPVTVQCPLLSLSFARRCHWADIEIYVCHNLSLSLSLSG